MTQPYTTAKVNAAVAATVEELRAKVDAANARVAELERIWAWAESEKRLAIQQASETKGTMRAMCSGYAKAMAKISSRMEKALTQ